MTSHDLPPLYTEQHHQHYHQLDRKHSNSVSHNSKTPFSINSDTPSLPLPVLPPIRSPLGSPDHRHTPTQVYGGLHQQQQQHQSQSRPESFHRNSSTYFPRSTSSSEILPTSLAESHHQQQHSAGSRPSIERLTSNNTEAASRSMSSSAHLEGQASQTKMEQQHSLSSSSQTQLPPPPGYYHHQQHHSQALPSHSLHGYAPGGLHSRQRTLSQSNALATEMNEPSTPWNSAINNSNRPSTSSLETTANSMSRQRSQSPQHYHYQQQQGQEHRLKDGYGTGNPSQSNSSSNGGEGCKKRKYAGTGMTDIPTSFASGIIPSSNYNDQTHGSGTSSTSLPTPSYDAPNSRVSPFEHVDELSGQASASSFSGGGGGAGNTAGGGGGGGGSGENSAGHQSASGHSPSPSLEGDEKGGNGRTLKQTKRAAQNRAAQQAFRKRKEERMKELEEKEKILNGLVAREAEVVRKERELENKIAAAAANSTGVKEGTHNSSSSHDIASNGQGSSDNAPSSSANDWERAFSSGMPRHAQISSTHQQQQSNSPSNYQHQHQNQQQQQQYAQQQTKLLSEQLEVASREKAELQRALEDARAILGERESLIVSLRRSLEDLGSENHSLREALGGNR